MRSTSGKNARNRDVIKNVGPHIDVVLLYLTNGQMTTKSEKGQLVFGSVPYPPKP